jgi:hypothetical protein
VLSTNITEQRSDAFSGVFFASFAESSFPHVVEDGTEAARSDEESSDLISFEVREQRVFGGHVYGRTYAYLGNSEIPEDNDSSTYHRENPSDDGYPETLEYTKSSTANAVSSRQSVVSLMHDAGNLAAATALSVVIDSLKSAEYELEEP